MVKTTSLALSFAAMVLTVLTIAGCSNNTNQNIVQWPTDKNCDLHHTSCIAKMGDAEVALKISPHPIPIARPLGIEVAIKNLQVQKMELDISGVNMYMGFNRVELRSINSNRFVGTSMLAFCTTQKMIWQVTLIIHQPDGNQIQIPYNLETVNRL